MSVYTIRRMSKEFIVLYVDIAITNTVFLLLYNRCIYIYMCVCVCKCWNVIYMYVIVGPVENRLHDIIISHQQRRDNTECKNSSDDTSKPS